MWIQVAKNQKFNKRFTYSYLIISLALILSTSYLDVSLRRIIEWNKTSTYNSFVSQFKGLPPLRYINSMVESKKALVISDNPIKFFGNAPLIIPQPLDPKEVSLWEGVKNHKFERIRAEGFEYIITVFDQADTRGNLAEETFAKKLKRWSDDFKDQDFHLVLNDHHISVLDIKNL